VFDVFKSGQFFPYVITVCDESEAAGCPIFLGVTYRLHWSFPDPSALTGTYRERLEGTCADAEVPLKRTLYLPIITRQET